MARSLPVKLLISTTALLLFVIPSSLAHATNGACSYHGGVDCAAGPQPDGIVICNDGWTGSSVSYSSMIECEGYNTTPTCPLMSYYNGSSCTCDSGYIVQNGSCVNANSYCWHQIGYESSYDSLSKSCECDSGYVLSGGQCTSETLYCEDRLGLMSQYDSLTQSCECMPGYQFDGTSCAYKAPVYTYTPTYYPPASSCPANSYQSPTDSTKCLCNTGYQTDATRTSCVAIPSTTSTQAPITRYPGTGLTTTQVNAILSLLQSFGADASVIAKVAVSLEH